MDTSTRVHKDLTIGGHHMGRPCGSSCIRARAPCQSPSSSRARHSPSFWLASMEITVARYSFLAFSASSSFSRSSSVLSCDRPTGQARYHGNVSGACRDRHVSVTRRERERVWLTFSARTVALLACFRASSNSDEWNSFSGTSGKLS